MNRVNLLRIAAIAAASVLLGACQTESGMMAGSVKAQFVGSEKCSGCHAAVYASWKGTWHNKMVRTPKDGLMKDAALAWATDGKNAGPAKGGVDGKPYKLEDVQFVVGAKWKQRYLVKNAATGNHQFLDKQWNRNTKEWENYGQKNDWETNCVTCHATGVKIAAYDEKNPAATKTTMVERNTGCEACHGPGSVHAASGDKRSIFNPGRASKAEADKVCGYCHVRVENNAFKTAQGNPREDLPHPVIGDSYKAGADDWTTWYPDKVLLVGIKPGDRIDVEQHGDLKGAFAIDEQAKKSGNYAALKHHQQYQEHLTSAHAQKGIVGCSDCHSSHATSSKPVIDAKATCKGCHGSTYNADAMMPGTGRTVNNLYVRSHTFNKEPRKGGPTALPGEPEYFHAK